MTSKHWNNRYKTNDYPWEDPEPSREVKDLFKSWVPKGAKVLDIGCGLGMNARWLAKQGYKVTAIDLSEDAIGQAKALGGKVTYRVADILKDEVKGKFDVAFDRGCFHTFRTTQSSRRKKFAQNVAKLLKSDGLWISISGSADNKDLPGVAEKEGYPRISAQKLVTAVEPYFEIRLLRRGVFGTQKGITNFYCWSGVFKKRG